MTKEEFKKKKFSERHLLSRGENCEANWQVESVQGTAYYISCRVCGTEVQSGCVPKCLKNDRPDDSWIHDVEMGAR